MAVAALVTPGPVMRTHTPGRPVARAYPSAMNPAPCSWRGEMCRMFDRFKERFADRFYNCGVAEANMVSVAGGLAMSGMRRLNCERTISRFTRSTIASENP